MASKIKIPYGVDPDPIGGGFYAPTWPAKRKELLSVKRNHPASYESVYQCRPGRRTGAIFVEDDFQYFTGPKRLSEGISDPETAEFVSKFHSLVIGWDTAMEARSDSDHTVGVVGGFLPCAKYHRGEDPLIYGECEPHLDVYLLDLVRKKLQFGDLVAEFRAMHRKWVPLRHVVEKKGSGIQLYQSLPQIGIEVEGVAANESKRTRAIAGTEAGSTQGWFRQWRVYVPHGAAWVPEWKRELKDFTGEDDSEDDQVDGTVHLVNYAIQIGTSMAMISSDWAPDTVDQILDDQANLPEPSLSYLPPRAELLTWIQLAPEMSGDPMTEICGGCLHYQFGFCDFWRRQVVALDTCEHFELPSAA